MGALPSFANAGKITRRVALSAGLVAAAAGFTGIPFSANAQQTTRVAVSETKGDCIARPGEIDRRGRCAVEALREAEKSARDSEKAASSAEASADRAEQAVVCLKKLAVPLSKGVITREQIKNAGVAGACNLYRSATQG